MANLSQSHFGRSVTLSLRAPRFWRGVAIQCSLLLFALLSGCSTNYVAKDGPPAYYVDETKIPNAVPKPEPLAKYGNMPSYVVFGHRYHVLHSSTHYDQVGIASWYGTQFHTHLTSDHEHYNMLAMTAAHRTLPLPTYVEVTNLRNHLKVIVKVNDRGPFANNRIIDLSYVAAKKLHMLGHGTALVRVRAIDPWHSDTLFVAHNTRLAHQVFVSRKINHALYLQVGAFHNRNYAEQLQQQLTSITTVPINIRLPSAASRLYRVQLGPFDDLEAANKMTSRLKQLGIRSNKAYGA